MLLLIEALLWGIRFMLGAALFSFMNVVAWRLPQGKSPLTGRSFCPSCGEALQARDLVPVFSWLILRGRCRRCGAKIAVRYLLAELLGGALAVGCTLRFGAGLTLREGLFGMSWLALIALLACGLLFALALIDAKTQILPDELNLLLALCGLAGALLRPGMWASALAGAVCVSVPMLLLCLVIPGAFGGGDIKLMAAAGLLLGWQHTLLAAFLAVLGGGGYGAYLLARKLADRKDHFAFGPFLCTGIVLALLVGEPILQWYFRFF